MVKQVEVVDVRIEYDEKANYRVCIGNSVSEWTPFIHIAMVDDIVAFSPYFGKELQNKVFVLCKGEINVIHDVKIERYVKRHR